MTPQEGEIIRYIDLHGSITTPQVEVLLSIKERRAREILKEMTEKGLLEKYGTARRTYYTRMRV